MYFQQTRQIQWAWWILCGLKATGTQLASGSMQCKIQLTIGLSFLRGSVSLPHRIVPCTSAEHTFPRSSSATEALLTCSTDSGNPRSICSGILSWTTELIQLAICRTLQHISTCDGVIELSRKPQGIMEPSMSCGASNMGADHAIRRSNHRRKVARRHLWQAACSGMQVPRLEELVSFLLAAVRPSYIM